jgi:hypothetical protein
MKRKPQQANLFFIFGKLCFAPSDIWLVVIMVPCGQQSFNFPSRGNACEMQVHQDNKVHIPSTLTTKYN